MTFMRRTTFPPSRIGRRSSRGPHPRRAAALTGTLERLELREMPAIVGLSASASPAILRQNNPMNQPHAVQVALIRPVTLAGAVTETGKDVPVISFRVVDEYGRDQPNGFLPPQPGNPGAYFFSTRFGLNRTHRPGDRDGRQYTVLVTAQDTQETRITAI